jgi:hypothetical protein
VQRDAAGKRDIGHAINRAFLTAHLLTANAKQAERAVIEAIEQWDPAEGTEEAFLLGAVKAAIGTRARYESSRPDNPRPAGLLLPTELQPVLDLAPQLRRCFVLRVLTGLPRQVCSPLLHLNASKMDQYTCAALEYLSAVTRRNDSLLACGTEPNAQLALLGNKPGWVEKMHSIS